MVAVGLSQTYVNFKGYLERVAQSTRARDARAALLGRPVSAGLAREK